MPTNAKTIDEYNELLGEAIEARLVPLFQAQVIKLQGILCYDGEAIEPDGNASDLLVQIQILELFAECEEFLGYADEDKLLVIARVIKGSRKYQEARSLAEKLIAKVGS
ncbi:hypothetical protein VPH70E361_0189 [Vibrio phage 70E36-1]|nr:hypothetical protein SIPHO036v1_30001 [Vibrio phage 70E38.1]